MILGAKCNIFIIHPCFCSLYIILRSLYCFKLVGSSARQSVTLQRNVLRLETYVMELFGELTNVEMGLMAWTKTIRFVKVGRNAGNCAQLQLV